MRAHVDIGRQPEPRPGVSGLLDSFGECHERIRRFTGLAGRLAASQHAPDEEIAGTAAEVTRYFTVGLPLHQADEEESLEPRLRGRDPTVDEALDEMRDQHVDLEDRVGALVSLTTDIAADPPILRSRDAATRLARIVEELEIRWEAHLGLEESVIFPATAGLPRAELALIRAEIRHRREGSA